jgi:hypothetical protein
VAQPALSDVGDARRLHSRSGVLDDSSGLALDPAQLDGVGDQ